MSKHWVFSAEFKVQRVLEVLCGSKTITEICHEHDLKYDVLAHSKNQFLENAPQLFQPTSSIEGDHARIAELERMIGRLTLELEIAKKAPATCKHHRSETAGCEAPRRDLSNPASGPGAGLPP